MKFKESKIVVSSRIEPELKDILEEEALAESLSISNYVEWILTQRAQILEANELREEKQQLEVALEKSKADEKQLRQEITQLQELIRKQQKQLEVFESISWLTPSDLTTITREVTKLTRSYPKLSKREALLLSLATAIHNEESSWSMYTIEDFIEKNPNFLTSKILLS